MVVIFVSIGGNPNFPQVDKHFSPNLYKVQNLYILMDFYLVLSRGVFPRSSQLNNYSVKPLVMYIISLKWMANVDIVFHRVLLVSMQICLSMRIGRYFTGQAPTILVKLISNINLALMMWRWGILWIEHWFLNNILNYKARQGRIQIQSAHAGHDLCNKGAVCSLEVRKFLLKWLQVLRSSRVLSRIWIPGHAQVRHSHAKLPLTS
jgi:hypothetical protein